MPIYSYRGQIPVVDPTAFVHPTATLIGDVIIGARCYIGPGASLRTGLAALPAADFAVVLTVDTPDIGANVVARVLGAARRAPSGIARATYDGRPGHPVVIARGHWAALSDDEGARGFLAGRADVAAVDCADLATGADIDTR